MTNATPLAGRSALVTGASRGIGRATAEALAGAGARVALLARNEAGLAKAAAALGERALAVPADVTDPDAVRGALARVADCFGRLDILVNNAAVAWPARVEELSDADVRTIIDTNLSGIVHSVRAAVPLLRAGGGGHIVNVSSDSVPHPMPRLALYAATKGGVEAFTRALRAELAPDGIRVTLLRPGPTLTSFAEGWDPEAAQEALAIWQAAGWLRPGGVLEPEVVADSVVFAVTRPPQADVEFLEVRPR